DIITIGQWSILAGLLGARLYEVAFNWDYYGQFPKKILAVWEGGLAIHGGLIVGPLVGIWLARRWNVPILRGLDVTGPSFAIGQAIGRWGNFFNEEAFGMPTSLPWKLYSFWLGPFRVAQLASLAGVVVAVVGLAWTRRRAGLAAHS